MRMQSVKITYIRALGEGGMPPDPPQVHLQNHMDSTGATTACGIIDPMGWIVEYVDDPPDCKNCINVAKFFRNLRSVDGSLPQR